MNEKKCKNHPLSDALSICHSCNEYFCDLCLNVGEEYYYCNAPECHKAFNIELQKYNEVEMSKSSDIPKMIIDGEVATFCEVCLNTTEPKQLKAFIGTNIKLRNNGQKCPECGSFAVETIRKWFFGLLKIRKSYLIIANSNFDLDYAFFLKGTFISRKIKS